MTYIKYNRKLVGILAFREIQLRNHARHTKHGPGQDENVINSLYIKLSTYTASDHIPVIHYL